MLQSQVNSCQFGQQELMLEPAGTPSTLRSPSDNGLQLLSSRAFSPTGAIIHSAIAHNSNNRYARFMKPSCAHVNAG
jgi:hypothetical protein